MGVFTKDDIKYLVVEDPVLKGLLSHKLRRLDASDAYVVVLDAAYGGLLFALVLASLDPLDHQLDVGDTLKALLEVGRLEEAK